MEQQLKNEIKELQLQIKEKREQIKTLRKEKYLSQFDEDGERKKGITGGVMKNPEQTRERKLKKEKEYNEKHKKTLGREKYSARVPQEERERLISITPDVVKYVAIDKNSVFKAAKEFKTTEYQIIKILRQDIEKQVQ